MAKLNAAFVKTVTASGKYGDEHGLILRVTPRGTKQWIWRGTIRGTRRDLGLGGYPYTSLAEARQTAFEYRKLARQGGDPMAIHRGGPTITFAQAAEAVIEMHAPNWRDPRRVQNWQSSLQRYAYPRLGAKPVSDITAADVLAVIGPIWADKRETARKVKGRISAVLSWAVAEGLREDDPTAAVTKALPRNGNQVQHHKALPHGAVADAVATIAATGAWPGTKLVITFIVLTGCRSGEARGAQWTEIDHDTATWTIPATRSKTGREFRVPLSTAALRVLSEARTLADGSGLVFPSPTGRVLSSEALSKLLRENDVGCVVHGFRSSLRDWCGETGVPREVAEACLAHVADATERAYARGDLLARRAEVMEDWATYIAR